MQETPVWFLGQVELLEQGKATHSSILGASLVAQLVKNPPAMWDTWVRSWGWEDPWRRERLPTPVFLPAEFQGLYSPWNSPVQNTGVGSLSLLQGSSQPRDRTQVSCIAGRCFTLWNTREAHELVILKLFSMYSRTGQISKYIMWQASSLLEKGVINMEKETWITNLVVLD